MAAGMVHGRITDAARLPDLYDRFAAEVLPVDVPEATAQRFEALAWQASVDSGDDAIGGSEEDQIVFVARGATKLVAHASQGREQVVAFHFAGDLVTVPARGSHAYTLCALDDCELLVFSGPGFLELARGEAGIADELLHRTMQSLARSREKSITLGRKTAQERLASFLVSMAHRIGSPQSCSCILDLPMSRRDIADSLGLTIETISRQLGELREAGLLETSGRSIVRLLDLAALDARAGHLPAAD